MFPLSSEIALLIERTLRTAWPIHGFFTLEKGNILRFFPCSPCLRLWLRHWGQLDPSMNYLLWKIEKLQYSSHLLCDCTFDWEDAEDSLTRHVFFTLKKVKFSRCFHCTLSFWLKGRWGQLNPSVSSLLWQKWKF
jgi:hypothetical protein